MIIKNIQVKNFRCIEEATLETDVLTVLVGRNGAGKSTFLKALDLFYQPNAHYTEEDFFNKDTSCPIEITVTFGELTEKERELFKSHIDGDTLTVSKIFTWPFQRGSQKYYGKTKRNPDFQFVRMAQRVTDKRQAYRELRELGYSDLPDLPGNASKEDIENALQEWEERHPDKLKWIRDEGQFFGFKEVGQARLERFTRFILIPAVRDASQDATEGRGAIISQLMDLVVRKTLAEQEDIKQLREETQKKYKKILDPYRLQELQKLQSTLTNTIQLFAPETEVILDWQEAEEIQIPLPKAYVTLREHGFVSAVEKTGHGTQRAFILTMLHHLAIVESSQTKDESERGSISFLPNIILGIEEPELYQHPTRLRHLAEIFLQLVSGGIPGVGQFQIIYTTHSPLLVDLQRFDQIRVLRRISISSNKPKHTEICQASLEEVTRIIEKAETGNEGNYNPEGTCARLKTLMTPWTNEGFFADVVVLVEGEEDRAAILGIAKAMGYSFDSEGISVIPCMGKSNLHKAAAVFKALSIPIYVIWDSDEGKKDSQIQYNHTLLRFFDKNIENYPARIEENFACFKKDLTTVLKEEIGQDLYNKIMEEIVKDYGYQERAQARKNPLVVEELIKRARAEGNECKTLIAIVEKILKLKGGL